MTPHETNLYIKDYQEKHKIQQEDNIVTAYLTAGWARVKRLPNIKKLLGIREKPKNKMSPEQILSEVKKMNEALGGSTY